MASFEIILPIRNPSAVLRRTAESLAEQTDRDFAVLISDNSSGSAGGGEPAEALALLQRAGVTARLVRPPEELGRVEHWNWSHRQATADWIKPLFTGDWLSPGYVAAVRREIAAEPGVELVNCSFCVHRADGVVDEVLYPAGLRSPAEVLAEAYRVGNHFGGPVNICFRRLAFDSVGGYPPALPVSADFWLILMVALRRGLRTVAEPLAHFHAHNARFSSNFPHTQINGDRELFTILLAATSLADFTKIPGPVGVRNRFFRFLLRRWVKGQLGRWTGRSA